MIDQRVSWQRFGWVTAAGVLALASVALCWLHSTQAVAGPACPNEAFRTGPSAALPDCRAYEQVTPAELNGRYPLPLGNFESPRELEGFPTELLSPSRTSFLYMTHQAPPPSAHETNGASDLFQVQRTSEGWRTVRRLSPWGSQAILPHLGGVSSDHAYGFDLVQLREAGMSEGTLSDEGHAAYLSQPDGSFELTGKGSLGEERHAQGRYISAGGQHVIFTTGKVSAGGNRQSVFCSSEPGCQVLQLEPVAPPTGTGAVYDREADGATHVISLFPGDISPKAGQEAFYRGVSNDASSVAFTIEGTLYARVDNGEATERTVEAAGGAPVFAGFSEDGTYLFYVAGGESGTIHRFDAGSKEDIAVNPGAAGEVVNVSADGSHVYFVSEDQIGGEGLSGEPNLYVWSGGSSHLVATVAPSDLVQTSGAVGGAPNLANWTDYAVAPAEEIVAGHGNAWEQGPGANSSRTTPDGSVLVFESKAELTSYQNAGKTEIYRYEEASDSLMCVSCNPSGAAAESGARLEELRLLRSFIVVRNLTDDGSRVFFETAESLIPRDTDGVNDIYEWREGGPGGGSVELISSGSSHHYLPPPEQQAEYALEPNVLYAVSPEGEDVVFVSQDPLLPNAGVGGAPALYDARVDGGFPELGFGSGCSEEDCRPSLGKSGFSPTIAQSEQETNRGNVKPRKRHRHRCRRRHHRSGDRHHLKRCAAQNHKRTTKARASASATLDPLGGSEDEGSWNSPEVPNERVMASSTAAGAAGAVVASKSSQELFDLFGIKSVGVIESDSAAGSHPDFSTIIELKGFVNKNSGKTESIARAQELGAALPPGLIGNPQAFPRCDTGDFLSFGNCPIASQVGVAKVIASGIGGAGNKEIVEPLYNLAPPHPDREVARLGFQAVLYPVFIDVSIRTAGDYGVIAIAHSAPAQAALLKAVTTLWGDPTNPVHNEDRFTPAEALKCEDQLCEGETGEVPRTGMAFMTNPSACQGGEVTFHARSYQLPGEVFEKSTPSPPITNCTGLPFAPSFTAEPTSKVAGAPTGLKTKLVLPQHLMASERATATMREARVTLSEGMQVAAGAANWIGTCSDAQVGYHEEVDTACPDNSKLGTAKITSPALSTPIEGTIYQRSPSPGHQFGLWLTADALGMHIKLPGELEPDKTTGRLTAVFRDLPQVPVEEIDLNVWGGDRAPLQNPDHCGAFTTDFSFSPHSDDPAATGQSQTQITEGCNQGFSPSLKAGVTEPVAGKFSPFVFDLTRDDGQQALRGFHLKLPDGELAKLKGVPLCGDADAAAATCPASSRIGSLQATTGPGPEPFTLPEPGKPQPQIYLAGPYQGAPFSIVSEVPAQAGPFDLGVLAVRSGLEVEPETGRAVVKADPLPQFFEGVGIAYRHLHAVVDRPGFSLNPTDCREMAVTSDVTSTQGAVAHPSARFQVDGCKALKFKPKLSLELQGGTKRADYPALTAVLKARKGDANIAFASVALPHSEFLAQEHIGTICTRKQFVADKCPKDSVYGKAKAFTPLLAKPLSGPVYLRSSDHPLPDLVAKLGGQLEIHLVGRIDSVHGGIRTTFETVPDAPVSKFVLQMKGGKKGLLTNSTDICRGGNHRATVAMRAQNGRALTLRPTLTTRKCGSKR